MERRYRIAGYSERPVRESELWFADVIGDDERAERAYARWQAADRDDMSDCHACELNGQGHYAMLRGDDARALEVWQPVLAGDKTCAEEPHRVLATALLPLLRLGRFEEARAQHLRGYRMARGKESLLPSVGKHIEFCALTGNEPRGLEILAEHAAHVAPLANLDDRLSFHGGVLVLLRRLKDLGHGHLPAVPYEGVPRTVAELYEVLRADALDIARRFDARNGTTRVSERFLARIGGAPLVDVLPLGVRSAALPQPEPAAAPVAAPVPAPATDGAALAELVRRARAARDLGHPGSDGLWAEVAARVGTADAVDPLVRVDVADHRALAAARAGAGDAAALVTAVRDGYRALGREERAALSELRLASVAAQSGGRSGGDPGTAGRGPAGRRGAGGRRAAAGPPDRARGTVRDPPGVVPALAGGHRRPRSRPRPRPRPRPGTCARGAGGGAHRLRRLPCAVAARPGGGGRGDARPDRPVGG
ncbi:hypothetical protein GCM10020254_44480 [Streptomyces goshikiensis]